MSAERLTCVTMENDGTRYWITFSFDSGIAGVSLPHSATRSETLLQLLELCARVSGQLDREGGDA